MSLKVNLPWDHFPAAVRVELRVLTISQIHLKLLFCSGIETEVCLVREVVRVEQHLDEARLRDERLWLLRLTAERTRIFTVAYVSLCVAIHDLKRDCGGKWSLKLGADHD